jgi:hypothetical protein
MSDACRNAILIAAEVPGNFAAVINVARAIGKDPNSSRELQLLAKVIGARAGALWIYPKDGYSREESELIILYHDEIIQAVVPEKFRQIAKFRLRDGFITSAEMSASNFVEYGEAICREFPITHLQISEKGDVPWQQFFAKERLKQLRSLSIDAPMGDSVSELLDCPNLKGLTELHLKNVFVGSRSNSINRFIREGDFPRVEALSLRNCGLGGEQMIALAQATGFPLLQRLDVSSNFFLTLDFTHLDAAPGFSELVELNLNDSSTEAIKLPTNFNLVPNLRYLRLSGNHLRRENFINLVERGFFKYLQRVDWGSMADGDLAPHINNLILPRNSNFPPSSN